mgnify:FL=1
MKRKKKEKDIEVNLAILETIGRAAEPMLHRLDCLLEDHYSGSRRQSNIDLMALLEYRASTQILKVMIEEYLDLGDPDKEEKVPMPFEHFTLIATTSKTIETAYRSLIGNVPLWTH